MVLWEEKHGKVLEDLNNMLINYTRHMAKHEENLSNGVNYC